MYYHYLINFILKNYYNFTFKFFKFIFLILNVFLSIIINIDMFLFIDIFLFNRIYVK